jgi:RNA polymerase sigma-70 factor (ECF subfamily)
MAETDDLALARRLLAGDERAFAQLFDWAFPALCRFALVRVGGDRQLAEELAQATLCRAVGKLVTYRGEAALLTWLCTICRHQIDDHFAARQRRPPMLSLVEGDPNIRAALESLARAADGPEERLRRREIARWVHVALDALPARYAEALAWKYLHELSVAEIGSRLELTGKATESLLTRARQAFRDSFSALAATLPRVVGDPERNPR